MASVFCNKTKTNGAIIIVPMCKKHKEQIKMTAINDKKQKQLETAMSIYDKANKKQKQTIVSQLVLERELGNYDLWAIFDNHSLRDIQGWLRVRLREDQTIEQIKEWRERYYIGVMEAYFDIRELDDYRVMIDNGTASAKIKQFYKEFMRRRFVNADIKKIATTANLLVAIHRIWQHVGDDEFISFVYTNDDETANRFSSMLKHIRHEQQERRQAFEDRKIVKELEEIVKNLDDSKGS